MNVGHLRTILWLRWRLTRNQWSRGGSFNAVLTIVVLIFGCIIGGLGSLAGLLVGAFVLDVASAQALLGVWDVLVLGFLFFWMIGLVSEIQRSEVIDIGRMLHLPVSLKDIFLINYLASHLTPSIILFLPGMLGLALGLTLGRGVAMLVMLPLVLGFIFMITAWTYCLRGWLVTLMANPRRRRAVIAGVTFTFILLVQIPNFLGNFMHDRGGHRAKSAESVQSDAQVEPGPKGPNKKAIPEVLLTAHKVVPFLWVGYGAMSLACGSVWPAALGVVGTFGLGALGLRRAYRSTIRFYQGQAKVKKPARKPRVERPTTPGRFLERRIPGVSDEAAALALAFLRSLTRASEVKMMLAANVLMLLFFGVMMLMQHRAIVPDDVKPFFATGAVAFTFFGLVQLMFNLFGMDRGGFRALVLLPVPRRQILLGKNLTFLPIVLGIGGILLIVIKFARGLSGVVILAAVLQLFAVFFLLSMAGNLVSVLLPHRVAPGSLKPTKMSTLTTLLLFGSRLLFPLAMLPIFLAPGIGLLMSRVGWLPAAPTNLFVSALVLGLLALLYRISLNPLGNLLQKHEKRILDIVTQEIE